MYREASEDLLVVDTYTRFSRKSINQGAGTSEFIVLGRALLTYAEEWLGDAQGAGWRRASVL